MKFPIATLSLCALIPLSFTTAAAADVDSTADVTPMVEVRTTNFSGRPPFKRRVEHLPTAEVARLEAATTEVVKVSTDFRGRPPFARNVEVLRVVDTARLEIDDVRPTVRHRSPATGRVPNRY